MKLPQAYLSHKCILVLDMQKQPLAGHADVDTGYAETEEVVVGPATVGELILAQSQLVAAAGVRVVGGDPGKDGTVRILQFQERILFVGTRLVSH